MIPPLSTSVMPALGDGVSAQTPDRHARSVPHVFGIAPQLQSPPAGSRRALQAKAQPPHERMLRNPRDRLLRALALRGERGVRHPV